MTVLGSVSRWLRCPVCLAPLEPEEGALVCPSRHAFDIAKQGYVNLLGRGSPANADTADMVAARHRFLTAGHYDPITDAVASEVPDARRLLDVGAGTGHHLARILDQMPEDALGLAADVSVPASRRAARAHPRMAAVVADTWAGLPLTAGSVDAVLCIFAPRNPVEFSRVLAPGGVLAVVIPRPEHLRELRQEHHLLEVGENKLERLAQSMHGHLEHVSSTDIAYDLALTAEQGTDLVAMGPNAFHGPPSIPASRVRVSVSCVTFTTLDEAGG